MLHIDNHDRAHHIHGFIAQNSRRKQIQNKLASFVYHGVPGIVSALITDNHIIFFTEQIDHAAFALVSPVRSNYSCQHESRLLLHLFIFYILYIYFNFRCLQIRICRKHRTHFVF